VRGCNQIAHRKSVVIVAADNCTLKFTVTIVPPPPTHTHTHTRARAHTWPHAHTATTTTTTTTVLTEELSSSSRTAHHPPLRTLIQTMPAVTVVMRLYSLPMWKWIWSGTAVWAPHARHPPPFLSGCLAASRLCADEHATAVGAPIRLTHVPPAVNDLPLPLPLTLTLIISLTLILRPQPDPTAKDIHLPVRWRQCGGQSSGWRQRRLHRQGRAVGNPNP
jgi:hypothetical protein